ncbi:MAG: hypothetical protein MR649_09215 [Prevotella sp.]|nr:hypothetical protein [Prevotella sp.]
MATFFTAWFFLFTMYLGHEKPLDYKRGKLKTFGAWLLMVLSLADMALDVYIALQVQNTYNELGYTLELFRRNALSSILMFGWAVYILKSGPLRSKKWKRVVKSILYFLLSFMLIGSSSPNIIIGIVTMLLTVVLFFSILLINTREKSSSIK